MPTFEPASPDAAFEKWWLTEGIHEMPAAGEPPQHPHVARAAWAAGEQAGLERAAQVASTATIKALGEGAIRIRIANAIRALLPDPKVKPYEMP